MSKMKTLDNFKKLLDISCNDPDLYGYITLDIDDLYFAHDFLPRNLEQVSFNNIFPPVPGTGPPQQGGFQTPAPGSQSAMTYFDLTKLPVDVHARVKTHRSDELMTMKSMT